MNPQTLASMIVSLKGAPISILVTMRALGRSTGPTELELLTGYSDRTLRSGLRRLAFLDLAERNARYQGWTLTARGHRWLDRLIGPSPAPEPVADPAPDPVPEPENQPLASPSTDPPDADKAQLPTAGAAEDAATADPPPHPPASPPAGEGPEPEKLPVEEEKIPLPPWCSSYSHGSSGEFHGSQDPKPRHHEQQTTTWGPEGEKLPLAAPARSHPGRFGDPQLQAAVDALQACGCPVRTRRRRGARDAVERAVAHGWSGAEVLAAVEGWLAYADTPAGRTIKHKGFFAMSRLRLGEPAPVLQASPKRQAPPVLQAPSSATNDAAARDAQARAYIEAQYERIVRR